MKNQILVPEVQEEKKTISSLEVAEMLEKKHNDLLIEIEGRKDGKGVGIIPVLESGNLNINHYFIESTYKSGTRSYKCYIFTLKGLKTYIDFSRKTHKLIKLINLYNSMYEDCNEIILVNRFEDSFKECLVNTLKAMNIEIDAQKSMFNGKYRIDFYLPQYNLSIEYDEVHHKNQISEDLLRQRLIENELGCKFIRLDYRNNDNYNVGLVLKEIIKVA